MNQTFRRFVWLDLKTKTIVGSGCEMPSGFITLERVGGRMPVLYAGMPELPDTCVLVYLDVDLPVPTAAALLQRLPDACPALV